MLSQTVKKNTYFFLSQIILFIDLSSMIYMLLGLRINEEMCFM